MGINEESMKTMMVNEWRKIRAGNTLNHRYSTKGIELGLIGRTHDMAIGQENYFLFFRNILFVR